MRLLLLLSLPITLFAQNSAYQTADSTTSIFLQNSAANLIFNVSDNKFDIGYLHEGGGHASLLYGFDFVGKPTSNLSTQIFQTGSTPPSLGGSASIGIHAPFAKAPLDQSPTGALRDDWALVQFTYTRQSFTTVLDANTSPAKQKFDGYKVIAAYNQLLNAPGPASVLWGVAAGVQRSNNIDDLKAVTINTPVLESATGISPFVAVKQSSGYVGEFRKYVGAPIYTDVAFIPKSFSWLSLDLYTRSNLATANRYIQGGVGLFLARPEDPTKVLGGITWGWRNGTPTLSFVAGWTF